MRAELEGTLDKPNPDLWAKFFPNADLARDGDMILQSLKESGLYDTTNRPSARTRTNRPSVKAGGSRASAKASRQFAKAGKDGPSARIISSRRTTKRAKGLPRKKLTQAWKEIPHPPVGKESRIKEKDITKGLVPILNAIISHQGLSDTRVAVDCQDHGIPTFDGNYLKPDVFLWGKGTRAFRHVDGIPTSNLRNASGKPADKAHLIDWRWCVIPIEIKTERNRYEDDDRAMFQLATYVREVFAAQPHRRFVPSLLFTESTVEFFLWDREGVIFSETLDYHAKAARFCSIIATIVSWKDEELGFDITAGISHDGLHIWTGSHVYVVKTITPVAQPYNIRSPGTTSWRGRRSNDN
jgi:Fungal protein kinase